MPNPHASPYGVGLAYRYVIHPDILQFQNRIDLLELPTEDYIVRRRKQHADPDEALLREALAAFPCVAHGISLSIGSVEPLDGAYLRKTREFLEAHDLEIFSEHLALHRFNGRDLTIFLAMPFEETSVQWVKRNYQTIRESLGRPFALENITYPFPVPHNSLTEADFLRRLTEETDCTLLLDVTNVFNNSRNHGYDAGKFLDRLPLDRVSQIHLAGGVFMDHKWEDSHSHPVMKPVWELFEEVVRRSPAEIAIIERDSRFHPFDVVMEDVEKAREIFYRHRPERPAAPPPSRRFTPSPQPVVDAGSDRAEFDDLRGFEEALMARITVPEFREFYARDPKAALASIPMSADWRERARLCDPLQVEKLGRMWDAFQRQEIDDLNHYEQEDWAAWAREIK